MVEQQINTTKLQQQKLKQQADWDDFLQSECKELGKYHKVGLFGDPVKRKHGIDILLWVWTYMYKDTKDKINKDTT